LLLDENLSERLLPLLIERFPHSTHVRLIGLGGASDTAIWKWASQQVLVLVTKDEVFLDRKRQQRRDGVPVAPAGRDD
jgi:predicted nuclease of predicted toxin-antitoxin system